jgi:hypothetical protein
MKYLNVVGLLLLVEDPTGRVNVYQILSRLPWGPSISAIYKVLSVLTRMNCGGLLCLQHWTWVVISHHGYFFETSDLWA